MATDKCIMAFMFLIVCGVVAIIVVKVSYGNHYHSSKFNCSEYLSRIRFRPESLIYRTPNVDGMTAIISDYVNSNVTISRS